MNTTYVREEGSRKRLCLTAEGRRFLIEHQSEPNSYFIDKFGLSKHMISAIRRREDLERSTIHTKYYDITKSSHGGRAYSGGNIVLNEAGKAFLREHYQTMTHKEMAQVIGLCVSYVCKRCQELGLVKDFIAIVRANCVKAREAYMSMSEEEKKAVDRKKGEAVKRACRAERRRREIGYSMSTRHLPQFPYSQLQTYKRKYARRIGYILGDYHEESCERYTIFYDSTTERHPIFEANASKAGLTFKEIKHEGQGQGADGAS